MGESLDRNNFYRALVTTYERWFRLAGEQCYIVCVPHNSTVGAIDEVMICSHILKPSPLLKMNYIPLNSSRIASVERTDRAFISTARNGSNKIKANIIEIEIGYNSKSQNYEIILIDSPLTEKATINRSPSSTSALANLSASKQQEILADFQSCCSYLRTLSLETVELIERKVQQLLNKYIILPDYLKDAADRINGIKIWAQEQFLRLAGHQLNPDLLDSAIECFIMGLAHDKVYAAVQKRYEIDEREFAHKLKNIGFKCPTLTALGCDPIYKKFEVTDEMKRLLKELELQRTGLEKVTAMKNILNEINDGLSQAISSNATPFDGQAKASILPDDLVAAVIHLLLNAPPSRLLTNIRYIEEFNCHLPTKNEFGYSLVTFQVAIEYVNNSSVALENASHDNEEGSRRRGYSFMDFCRQTSQLDSDLEKITKLIESKTSIDEGTEERPYEEPLEPPAKSAAKGGVDDLGDFLSALQQNKFAVNFGQQ